MANLEFSNLEFEEREGSLNVRLMGMFEFRIPLEELSRMYKSLISRNSIELEGMPRAEAERKFNRLVAKHLPELRNRLNGRKAVYIHKNSGIPLFGTLYFGIVDKGTRMIEVKPVTGCNIDCSFCSVGEGLHAGKMTDYVVEEDYLIEELEYLLEFKSDKGMGGGMEVFINPHGEPLLYQNIVSLVRRIAAMEQVGRVSVMTNGALLSEDLIDRLADAGLSQINLSLNTLSREKGIELSGRNYDSGHVRRMAEYASKKLDIVLAPVWLKGVNDSDMEDLISFAKELGCRMGIQKFIAHRKGKKPAKEISWEEFSEKLDEWGKKHGVKLGYNDAEDAGAANQKTEELPMSFRRGDVIKAAVVCRGRRRNERIAAAEDRAITVFNCSEDTGRTVNIRIKTAKHNIFAGEKI
ncbi:MAG: radical SAM protein [Candidatus Woesearchaeota archaeon]